MGIAIITQVETKSDDDWMKSYISEGINEKNTDRIYERICRLS